MTVGGIVARDRRAPNLQAAERDAFIDQKDGIRNLRAESWDLVERAVMIAGYNYFVAVGQFA
jgi:hypothetical protein